MNKIKTTNILHVTVQPNKRLIFVSDIHGDLNTFKVGLEKINFNEDVPKSAPIKYFIKRPHLYYDFFHLNINNQKYLL